MLSPATKTGWSLFAGGGGGGGEAEELDNGCLELAAGELESSTAFASVRLRDLEGFGLETNLGFRAEKIGGFGFVNLRGGLRQQLADPDSMVALLHLYSLSFSSAPTACFAIRLYQQRTCSARAPIS